MSQSKILLAFRARLRSRGYTDIRITRAIDPSTAEVFCDSYGYPMYCVTCVEPLLDFTCTFAASEPQMANWPGISFSNAGFFSRQTSLDDEEAFFCELFPSSC